MRDPFPTLHVRRAQRLVAFARVELRPGERRAMALDMTAEAMASLDDEGRWRVVPGEYRVTCGTNSADKLALSAPLRLA